MKIFYFYMQDKRAEKTIPANGTAEYPMYYIGQFGIDGALTIKDFRVYELVRNFGIDREKFDLYVFSDDFAKWYEAPEKMTGLLSQSRP